MNSHSFWARMGSESIGTGTPVDGIAVSVMLVMPPPEGSLVVATVVFEIAGDRYGPVEVQIPDHETSCSVPTAAISGLDLPNDTDVAVRLTAITAPFTVDEQRNVMHSTLGTLLHRVT